MYILATFISKIKNKVVIVKPERVFPIIYSNKSVSRDSAVSMVQRGKVESLSQSLPSPEIAKVEIGLTWDVE